MYNFCSKIRAGQKIDSTKIRPNFRKQTISKMKLSKNEINKSIIVVNLDSDWTVWHLLLTFYSFILGKTILTSSKFEDI